MPYFCVFFVGFFRDGTRNSSEISYIIHRQTSKSRYSAISFVFVGRNRGPGVSPWIQIATYRSLRRRSRHANAFAECRSSRSVARADYRCRLAVQSY